MTSTNFKPITFFRSIDSTYKLLPFNFKQTSKGNYLLSNIAGEFIFLKADEFREFVGKKLSQSSNIYNILRDRHFLAGKTGAQLDILASKLWTKKSVIKDFTKLHIFILTLRCNCACTYCQASRKNEDESKLFDMDIQTARRSVEVMMQAPSPKITVEFQGGEPLLNFEVMKEVIRYSKELNQTIKKDLSYVVCTNLSILTNEILDFLTQEQVHISTSVDGPAHLHDLNRCRSLKTARHEIVVKNIHRAREALGRENISALMTTTKQSLPYAKEIIDEYVRLDLGSIFIRALNPYGFAVKTEKAIGYSTDEFIKFYKEAFNRILEVNKQGVVFPEAYATLLLRKILTPWPVGFVDLQSPTGNGFAVTVYNYDGDVYASDESRMLYEMGDSIFCLGNIFEHSYRDIYFGASMQLLAANGLAESLAGCSDCVYVPYCGADPVRHYATQNDPYGNRPTSSFCAKNKQIFDFLFNKLQSIDHDTETIFWSWIHGCPPKSISITK